MKRRELTRIKGCFSGSVRNKIQEKFEIKLMGVFWVLLYITKSDVVEKYWNFIISSEYILQFTILILKKNWF